MGLGLNFYTQWYWKIDLHNLMHFSGLRLDEHAQHEINWLEIDVIQELLRVAVEQPAFTREGVADIARNLGLRNARERDEMMEKLHDLGFLK